jgi:hypothetical protein
MLVVVVLSVMLLFGKPVGFRTFCAHFSRGGTLPWTLRSMLCKGYGTASAAEGKGCNKSHNDFFHMHGNRY